MIVRQNYSFFFVVPLTQVCFYWVRKWVSARLLGLLLPKGSSSQRFLLLPLLSSIQKLSKCFLFLAHTHKCVNTQRLQPDGALWCFCVQLKFMGNVDVDRVSNTFREALTAFMSKRKSPLTNQMFIDLFSRFPVSTATRRPENTTQCHNLTLLCYFQVLAVNLLDTAVQHITSGVREHQQVKMLASETIMMPNLTQTMK